MSEIPDQFGALVEVMHRHPQFSRFTTSLAGPMVPVESLWIGGGIRDLYDELVKAGVLAPDPNALPLSTAMRMARARTEAGNETWVYAEVETPYTLKIIYRPSIETRWIVFANWRRPDMEGGWLGWGHTFVVIEAVESARCRLVTPEEGELLLRGEE